VILLWGLSDDPPLAAIASALRAVDAPYYILDQRRARETLAEVGVGETVFGSVVCAGVTLALESVTGAYIRPHATGSAHAQELADALLLWSEIADAVVVNRPSAMAANGSKPYQLARIAARDVGAPDTLVTTTADDARAFAGEHREVVYKSISGVRSIVSRLGTVTDERLEQLRWCPTQFQERIEGTDYRVHVVGAAVFAAKVESTSDDYRYPAEGDVPVVSAVQVPRHVERLCRDLASDAGLVLAGIDLRRTSDGRWYCFEINPSPALTYYEHQTGQPIAAAVAELLAAA
jgi:glutathione synthase/RimK-type ligase-like ATP-grasp enzyme